MRRCWRVARRSVGGGRWCSGRKRYGSAGGSQAGAGCKERCAPGVVSLKGNGSGCRKVEAFSRTSVLLQQAPVRAGPAAGSSWRPQQDAFPPCVPVAAFRQQQVVPVPLLQHARSQQQPPPLTTEPEQNGFTRPSGHRQVERGMPAATDIAAASQIRTNRGVLRGRRMTSLTGPDSRRPPRARQGPTVVGRPEVVAQEAALLSSTAPPFPPLR
jgi:hypothetical protein